MSRAGDLGGPTPTQKRTRDIRDTSGGGVGGEKTTVDLTKSNPDSKNMNMHPLFKAVMKPLDDAGIPLSVSKICKAAGLPYGLSTLKKIPNRKACFRWMLGGCKKSCPTGHKHLPSHEISDAYATELCHQISDGIAKLAWEKEKPNEPDTKKIKKEV